MSKKGQKIALITGASTGIGAATALQAAEKGYDVALSYLSQEDSARQVAHEIRRIGSRAVPIQADLGIETDIVRLFETVDRELGPITALVNNAATMEPQSRLESMDTARLHRMFAINAIGPILCAREAVRRMSTRHGGAGGAIVNVSSVAACYGSPGEYIDYAATKGALETMTIGLSVEVAEEGIRVNAVRPGFIYTGLHAKGGEPERVDRVKALVPMKRGGQPEEVASAILWLLSSEASYITGAILDVAGGR